MSEAIGAVSPIGAGLGGAKLTGHVDLSSAAQSPTPGTADPSAIAGQMTDGLRDLLNQNESINKVVSSEFGEAMAREQARTAGLPIPSSADSFSMQSGPVQSGFAGFSGFAGPAPLIGPKGATLPGPAESFPGFSREAQALQGKLYHMQDKMVIETNIMSVFSIESGMLHQISEQLSQAVNTLVRAS